MLFVVSIFPNSFAELTTSCCKIPCHPSPLGAICGLKFAINLVIVLSNVFVKPRFTKPINNNTISEIPVIFHSLLIYFLFLLSITLNATIEKYTNAKTIDADLVLQFHNNINDKILNVIIFTKFVFIFCLLKFLFYFHYLYFL